MERRCDSLDAIVEIMIIHVYLNHVVNVIGIKIDKNVFLGYRMEKSILLYGLRPQEYLIRRI